MWSSGLTVIWIWVEMVYTILTPYSYRTHYFYLMSKYMFLEFVWKVHLIHSESKCRLAASRALETI